MSDVMVGNALYSKTFDAWAHKELDVAGSYELVTARAPTSQHLFRPCHVLKEETKLTEHIEQQKTLGNPSITYLQKSKKPESHDQKELSLRIRCAHDGMLGVPTDLGVRNPERADPSADIWAEKAPNTRERPTGSRLRSKNACTSCKQPKRIRLDSVMKTIVDLWSRGQPPIPGKESGEAGPLCLTATLGKELLAGLGIQSRWKKPTDVE
ncbi:hypothetical protein K504DRAFT_451689 [Pleomassaria siparia CBS 279.74]|uniref:Uncharacterized protein n=1 Tax=Pleomassaria siparia CBS 279.74 TaxID=1314801 RepID=A0A6G1JT69_9PLEO|nr:hypothetical protein K504DRAFT_451689 [Pleomassaria siparia CBS 279.74]